MHDRILVTRSSMPPMEEYIEEIQELWNSRWLTNMGAKHEQLTARLASLFAVPYVSLFCNGHMALELCLQALDLEGEVITTPFTFISTTHAITRNGLTPVFCDISPDTYTIDADKIEALITPRTCAIVPVHVYGNICNIEKIQKIAGKYNLKVVYDAAHAFAETYKGKNVASFGDASIFSFHATKVFHSIEGGAVSTSNPELYERLYALKNFGIQENGLISNVGANAKMNEFQAAMGLCNLRHLAEEIALRKEAADRYTQHLGGVSGLRLLSPQMGLVSNYAYYPVIFEKEFGVSRDDVFEELRRNNVFSRKYFYPLTSECDCYSSRFNTNKTPIAKHISESVLTLPLYAHLSLEDIDRICKIILNMRSSSTCTACFS